VELARALAAKKDKAGIREIAEHLWDKNSGIAADCIKVLYEIGAIEPSLISSYSEDFVKLLKSRNNRLVWGAMTALAEVARAKPAAVYEHLAAVKKATEEGSVITIDNGMLALARVAAHKAEYNKEIFPYLLKKISSCRPKDVAQYAEKTSLAVNAGNKAKFISTLEKRSDDLSGSALARVKKVIK